MSTIRRQSIISSLVVYSGFALGMLNMYLFTRQGGFTEAQYGLTNTFIAIASVMFSVAGVGMPAYIGKFFPYYRHHTDAKSNDQLSWALLLPCLGFGLVVLLSFAFKDMLIDRVFANSPELPRYFYWTLPFGFGYTLFMVLEAYAWQMGKPVLSNLLKEVVFRLGVTVLIVLTTLQLIPDFTVFVSLYAFLYLGLVLFLVIHFYRRRQLPLNWKRSRVTRRFYSRIVTLVSFVWGGGLVYNLASVFDGLVITAIIPNGMAAAGIFYLAQNISSLIQAPQRAVVSSTIGPLSQAWKEKDLARINRIYHRSSINQLIFACGMFCLIWLNFADGIYTFHLRETYLQAQWIFFYIGLARIIDLGTGVNGQIIATSTFWRFDFFSGLILLALTLPLNWILTQQYGAVGPAYSNLISFTVYNAVRFVFLWRKFGMQPFTPQSGYTLLLAAGAYFICQFVFGDRQGLLWMALRSVSFLGLYAGGVLWLSLSPDIMPVWRTLAKRLGLRRQ